jgi:hypothetical protein
MVDDVLMPLLVIHQKTVDNAVWEDGWRDGQDFLIRSSDTSYVTRPIFKEYIRDVILKSFNTTRETMHLENFAGVLLCDNCSSHIDEEVMAILARENSRVITFPLHTSHLLQIAKPMKALEHATDTSNNRAAFKRAGPRIKPRVFPPVALVESHQLIKMIDASALPEGGGLMEMLNQWWPRNVPKQLPFSDSGMESISRITKDHIPSFRKRYELVISCG